MTEAPTQARPIDDSLLQSLQWRCIGPPRGGRVVAVAGDPVNRATFYFGACAGGVWKTEDGGTYWENVSDGFFETASVGAIAVADSDPNVVYAGMGEACIRLDVTHGDGVYKSTDAGKTWTHMGMEDTRHISRVRVHPNDPRHGLRSSPRPCLRSQPTAGRLQVHRRRQELGTRSIREPRTPAAQT